MNNKLPEYNPEKPNEVLFIMSDILDADNKLPIQAREPECFNKFFDELTSLCAKHSIAIDSYGIRKSMSERLAKKEFEKYKVELPTIVDNKTYDVYMIEHVKPKI
jgi:hypothetical protein